MHRCAINSHIGITQKSDFQHFTLQCMQYYNQFRAAIRGTRRWDGPCSTIKLAVRLQLAALIITNAAASCISQLYQTDNSCKRRFTNILTSCPRSLPFCNLLCLFHNAPRKKAMADLKIFFRGIDFIEL